MRVVAGAVGGRTIQGPSGADARPTTDKVRGAIFNSLESLSSLEGISIVDLFAGTGACGIEALSRGAKSATFVEKSRANADVIRANLRTLQLQGLVKVQDVLAFLEQDHFFDVGFVDPPYAFDDWQMLLNRLNVSIAVCESNRPVEPEGCWQVIRSKKYGGTHVTTLSRGESMNAGRGEPMNTK